jgi:hypothetical protein
MDNRVASRAKGDQQHGGVAARPTVMNRTLIPCSAALTRVAVASEDGLAVSREAPARARPDDSSDDRARQAGIGSAAF